MNKKSVTLSNKETIYYLEEGLHHQETIILVHGNMSSSVHYLPIIKPLSEKFHVIALDLRGFGDSTYHKPIQSLEDFADDIYSFLKVLKRDKIILVGWSAGGGVSLKFAAKYPNMIKKLILIESASIKGYPIFKKDEKYQPILTEIYQTKEEMAKDPVQVLPVQMALKNQDSAFMKRIWEAAIYNTKIPENIDLYISESLKQRNLIDLDWALMTFNISSEHNGVVDGDNTVDNILCPVLAIYGLKDLAVPKYMFDETVKALKNVKTHLFDEGSHSPITDYPEELAKLIVEFI
ncbi:intracellular short-chain-length polyhydroxyalkanoate depolymerase [Liberiplasma polymorphum]|uniref:intracellular short-chain-length polyhydroxyalkanoate depolymerase n=1 Tax=Liberiplasma polymorphum TaxID=3374570 RepID=UPI003774C829